jgi:protein TonB
MSRPEPQPESLAAIVLGARPARPRRWLLGGAFAVAGGVHAAFALGAFGGGPVEIARARPPREVMRIDHVVDLAPPPPPPAPARVSRAPKEAAPAPADPPPTPPSAAPPPAPAQAGAVVAAADDAQQAVEFADIVTGDGPAFAGGITATDGTSGKAVHDPHAVRGGTPGGRGTSLARSVGAPAHDWSCPWPSEAEELALDEEIVVLKVVVRADGGDNQVDVATDPGHGFGRVARECARAYRFPPALDDGGHPILATSPPIRVTFTRP